MANGYILFLCSNLTDDLNSTLQNHVFFYFSCCSHNVFSLSAAVLRLPFWHSQHNCYRGNSEEGVGGETVELIATFWQLQIQPGYISNRRNATVTEEPDFKCDLGHHCYYQPCWELDGSSAAALPTLTPGEAGLGTELAVTSLCHRTTASNSKHSWGCSWWQQEAWGQGSSRNGKTGERAFGMKKRYTSEFWK